MTDRDALTIGTRPTFDADNRPLYVPTQANHDALLDYLIEHDPREAARRAVLLRPGDDVARLAWAEELVRGTVPVPCPEKNCKDGMKYLGIDGMKWIPCPTCDQETAHVPRSLTDGGKRLRGTGRVPDGSAALGEMVRLGVELEDWMADAAERSLSPDGISRHAFLRSRIATLLPVVRAAGWFDLEGYGTLWDAGSEVCWLTGKSRSVRHQIRATISRGLPAHVRCSAAAWLAVAGAVCERFPIETVEISDREPEDDRGWMWFRGVGNTPSHIPEPVYELMPGMELVDWGDLYKGFDSRDAAALALNTAALRLGRYRAGLPALTEGVGLPVRCGRRGRATAGPVAPASPI